ncbi:hypothetical protein C0J52_19065 [Blattella germanica]|nr:hypothetical protein C0J52_19065 [Blattella germanica]
MVIIENEVHDTYLMHAIFICLGDHRRTFTFEYFRMCFVVHCNASNETEEVGNLHA